MIETKNAQTTYILTFKYDINFDKFPPRSASEPKIRLQQIIATLNFVRADEVVVKLSRGSVHVTACGQVPANQEIVATPASALWIEAQEIATTREPDRYLLTESEGEDGETEGSMRPNFPRSPAQTRPGHVANGEGKVTAEQRDLARSSLTRQRGSQKTTMMLRWPNRNPHIHSSQHSQPRL